MLPIILTRQVPKVTLHRLIQIGENEWPRRGKEIPWLQNHVQLPNLSTDLLLILDCPLVDLGSTTILNTGNGTLRFDIMSVRHGNPWTPGLLTSRLAGLLEDVAKPDNRIRQREFITTKWISNKFPTINHPPGQELELQLHENHVEDKFLQGIVIEPMDLPLFGLGSHFPLSRYEQARLFDYLSSVYENGLTEVFKVQMRHNPQVANNFYPLVNVLSSALY